MKLLIVDDEILTREGLLSAIDWNSLGINEIVQADDGLNGLAIAKAEKPDIVLCDIRMPRLTGIEMAEKLEAILPDTSLIFMSGYSDKEYLKAAIKLKAISYVEKPLNPSEVRDAVLEAIDTYEKKLRSRLNADLYSLEKSSHLALLLTKPYNDHQEKIHELLIDLDFPSLSTLYFTTYIVKLRTTEPDSQIISRISRELNLYLQHYHMKSVSISIHAIYHVFHVIGTKELSTRLASEIGNYLARSFSVFTDYFVSHGETVNNVSKVYLSYTSAAALLQSSFFFQSGSVLLPVASDSQSVVTSRLPENLAASFSDFLSKKEKEKCDAFFEQLYRCYNENRAFFPNQVKDIYYKLLEAIYENRQKSMLSSDFYADGSSRTIIESVQNCFTFQELHTMLVEKTEQYFQALEAYVPEDSTIFLIKDYISKHFENEALSIKEISDHVFLSASYVCTYFKNQTGKTLNQYLTEYRMEKAKQLLGDPRYQITDISSKVGYSNGNYFGKSFKKFTGLSPSKYREKILG